MSTEPIEDFVFDNYGKNLREQPINFYRPASEEELAGIVTTVAAKKTRLRVLGAGHSWSPIAVSGANMISLDALDKIVAVDQERRQVTVQAGIRLHALTDQLEGLGLSLP